MTDASIVVAVSDDAINKHLVRLNLSDPMDCRSIHVFSAKQWAIERAARINAEICAMVHGLRKVDDPRPSDMAELAMLVAVELRSRAIPSAHCAHNWPVVYVVRLYGSYADPQTMLSPYTLTNSAFDNLGPVAIATEIQQYEAQYLQEWAGNK